LMVEYSTGLVVLMVEYSTGLAVFMVEYSTINTTKPVPSWPHQQAINITSMTDTYSCVYSVETPDDGQ
jgi:hypothetical protein